MNILCSYYNAVIHNRIFSCKNEYWMNEQAIDVYTNSIVVCHVLENTHSRKWPNVYHDNRNSKVFWRFRIYPTDCTASGLTKQQGICTEFVCHSHLKSPGTASHLFGKFPLILFFCASSSMTKHVHGNTVRFTRLSLLY
jgi:hypothetical protein